MTSPTGRNKPGRARPRRQGRGPFGGGAERQAIRAFTLVELILVMALLVTLLAIAVPSLARSMRGHNMDAEAARLLALTEYARTEAVSQGIPMVVWVDPDAGRFGVEAQSGYTTGAVRAKDFTLGNDLHFDPIEGGVVPRIISAGNGTSGTGTSGTGTALAAGSTNNFAASTDRGHAGVNVAAFAPDGILDPSSVNTVRIVNHSGDAAAINLSPDGYGYEIVKGGR